MVRAQTLAHTAILAALALAACDARPQQVAQTEPPVTGVPAYLDSAVPSPPPPPQLPGDPVQTVRSAPERPNYRYIDRAYAMTTAFDEVPPDYAFDYDGVEPWAWRGGDGAYWVVEPLDVGERYYYYEPGSYRPFLVRDPDYAYAYDNGVLVEVYDAYGRPRRSGYTPYLADRARRYADRGQALYYAAQRAPRRNDYAPRWQARRNEIVAQQRNWARVRERNSGWRAWRQSPPAVTYQAAWAQERARRQTYAGSPAQFGSAFQTRQARRDQGQAPAFAGLQPQPRFARDQGRAHASAGQQAFNGPLQHQPGVDGRAVEQQSRRQQREAEHQAQIQARQAQAFNQSGRGGRHNLERQAEVQQQARVFQQQQRRSRNEGERQAQFQQRAQFQQQARQQREAEQQARFAERQAREQQHDFGRQAQAQQQQAQFAERQARQQQREVARQVQAAHQQAQRMARNEAAPGPRQGGGGPAPQAGGADPGGGKHGGGHGHGRDKG